MSLRTNHSNENEFDLHENGHCGETHFHMKAKGNSEMAYSNSFLFEWFRTRTRFENEACKRQLRNGLLRCNGLYQM